MTTERDLCCSTMTTKTNYSTGMMGKERVETNSGLSKDLYQVKETSYGRFLFSLPHSIICALAYFDPKKVHFKCKIGPFLILCYSTVCCKRYNVQKHEKNTLKSNILLQKFSVLPNMAWSAQTVEKLTWFLQFFLYLVQIFGFGAPESNHKNSFSSWPTANVECCCYRWTSAMS